MGTIDQLAPPDLRRLPPREGACRIPQPVPGEPGRFIVDATWGTIGPMEVAPGVRTVGELEVIEHIEAGRPLIDTRNAESFASGTIPTARNIPLAELDERIDEVDRDVKTVLFCNGPACAATPQAIHKLLAAGHPASQLRYYRGGMHDWLTLGLPTSAGTP
jgi:rhodanese-related sulfurtransferase